MKQQLTEALAWYDGLPQKELRNEAPEVAVILAAARLVERLLPGECDDPGCLNGFLDSTTKYPHKRCHGTGRVWDEGIVEAVAKALNAYVNTLHLSDEWDEVSPMGKDQYREQARAVLSAIAQLVEAGSQ